MTTLTHETPEGQMEQTQRVVTDAVRKAMRPLGKAAAQRVHEQGDQLALGIRKIIQELSTVEDYAAEQVPSSCTYPPDYHRVRPLQEQIAVLVKHFDLDSSRVVASAGELSRLPEGAEGWFAIPRWEAIADTYGEAATKCLECLDRSTKYFSNRVGGKLHARYLRESRDTRRAMEKIVRMQSRDILIIPAQFGLLHRGKSARRAQATFQRKEFGLGIVAVSAMLLTHPERKEIAGRLWINCIGDEYSHQATEQFTETLGFGLDNPMFTCCINGLGQETYWQRAGHVTGFLT